MKIPRIWIDILCHGTVNGLAMSISMLVIHKSEVFWLLCFIAQYLFVFYRDDGRGRHRGHEY